MRTRTLALFGLVVVALAAVLAVSLTVGVGPEGSVVAPVAAVINTERFGSHSCSLVRLDARDGARGGAPVPAANCTTHAITEPAFGDLDADPATETAVTTTEHALIVRDLDAERSLFDLYGDVRHVHEGGLVPLVAR